jgi:hypothetical protein
VNPTVWSCTLLKVGQIDQMKTLTIIVSGSRELIGSKTVEDADCKGSEVHGVDNYIHLIFFRDPGDTTWNLDQLRKATRNFIHDDLDIHDRIAMQTLLRSNRFDLIIQCTAQPSRDKTRDIAILDSEDNAFLSWSDPIFLSNYYRASQTCIQHNKSHGEDRL